MYDGIKIDCQVADPRKWDASLRHIGRYDEVSGEVLPFTEAKANGLTFHKVQTPTGTKYTIQGSLHRFARNGGENNDDYNLIEVVDTIDTLQDTYGINPERSKVINFEFGVNINLPDGITSGEYQKYLVAIINKEFGKMNPRKAAVGYIAEFDEYSVKVYDKGFQSGSGEKQQLRIEVKVLRTRWLEQFGIVAKGEPLYLSRLLDKTVIKQLGDILQLKISSLICTPRNIDEKKLTPGERLTFRDCRNARCWEEWNSKQRERKKKQLEKIFIKVNQPNPVDVLARLVSEKWKELTHFKVPAREPETREKDAFSTVVVVGFRTLIEMIITGHLSILRCLLTKGEISEHGVLIYAARGHPLGLPPPELTIRGYSRWIDLRCRSPT